MSKKQFSDFFDDAPVGLAICKMNGTLLRINQAYADIVGRTIEETLALDYWELTPEKYRRDEKLQLQRLRATGEYGPYEKEYITSTRSLVAVRLRGRSIIYERQPCIYSAVTKIESPYMSAMFNVSELGLALCTMDGELVAVNEKYAQIMQRTVEETLKLSYWNITPKIYEKEEKLVQKFLNLKNKYGPYEKGYLKADGANLAMVRLHGWKVQINGVDYIWSVVEDLRADMPVGKGGTGDPISVEVPEVRPIKRSRRPSEGAGPPK